ncbi:hypothetical protein Dimus_004607 [Dionaea muscipula]
MPQLFILAAVMHPKIKLRGIELLLKGISDNLYIVLPSASDVHLLLSTTYASYEAEYATNAAASTDPLPSKDIYDDPSSAGSRVLDDKRSKLALDILDCLICLKDWEDERLGIKKRSAKDEFRDYFTDSDIDAE